MQDWSQLYSVTGGSSATLLGLLFVAVSINASTTLGTMHQNSRRVAEQTFQNYLVVMSVSMLALFPALERSTVGYVTLGIAALRGSWALMRLYWAAKEPYKVESRLKSLRRQLPSLIGFALLIYAAQSMARDVGDTRTTYAFATITLLLSIANAPGQKKTLTAIPTGHITKLPPPSPAAMQLPA
jgi:hypothetical protein